MTGTARGHPGRSLPAHITILGGGVAGLAVGYHAARKGLPFTIYEAGREVGGNCVTLKHGEFLFDSGAHRFHNKDPETTEDLRQLLGGDLERVDIPSHIYIHGKHIDFPPSPLNLVSQLGPGTFARVVLEVLSSRLKGKQEGRDFESFALHTYGRTLAGLFLLNYSEKLWGVPCERLSRQAGVRRMKGLTMATFLKEAVLGRKAKTEHLDGSFYYPSMGIGAITEGLASLCGHRNIRTGSRITRIFHDPERVRAIEVNGEERIEVDEVVMTLPLGSFLHRMEPAPPHEILSSAARLRFRNLVLLALFLRKESVTSSGTVYFPDPGFPFTRVYEPRNRSARMSPPGKTSLVAEIPCDEDDAVWQADHRDLAEMVRSHLIRIGWIKSDDIIGSAVHRVRDAYPVLDLDSEAHVQSIHRFLKGFSNLKLAGRNATFAPSSIHEVIREGRELVGEGIRRRGE